MSLLHLYSPACCSLCGRETTDLPLCPVCAASWQGRRLAAAGRCPVCFQPLSEAGCDYCSSRHVFFDSMRALFPLDEAGRELMHHWKFENERRLFRIFVEPVVAAVRGRTVDCMGVISAGRGARSSRAYEPLVDLVRAAGNEAGLPAGAVIEKRRRSKQSAVRYEERFFHIAGSLSLTEWFSSGKEYLLLEDVFTTGATANEAARLLKASGATGVHVLALFQRQRDGIEWIPSHAAELET